MSIVLRLRQLKNNPLRDYRFRRLWLGLVVSRLGDMFTSIALLWFVLDLTGSGAALGGVLFCFSVPAIVTSPFIGRLLDIFQPRLVMGVDNFLRAIIVGAIPTLYWLGLLQLWVIFMLALLVGVLSPASNVGVRVIMPEMVPNDELEAANGLLSASEQFAVLIGPALAGFLITIVGGPPVLLFDAFSFLVLSFLLFSLPDVERNHTPESSPDAPKKRILSGFGALFQLKEVRIISTISFVFFLAYMPLEPSLPLYSRQQLNTDASGYGLLWSAFGAGAVVGLLLIPILSRYSHPGIVFSAIAIGWGALLLPLVWLTSLPIAMIFFAFAGCTWAPYTTIETTLLQRLIPANLRGQVFGARSTLISASGPLGVFIGSVLLQLMPANLVIGISALACILAGMGGLLSPRLRQITRQSSSKESAPAPVAQ